MSKLKILTISILALLLGACGTFTGLPSHGGGKRFAYEQTLVNISSRESLKAIPIDDLRGKKIRLAFSVFGDQGGGNLNGGRASIAGGVAAFINASQDSYRNLNRGDTTLPNGDVHAGSKNSYTYRDESLSIGAIQETQGYGSYGFYNTGDIHHLNNLLVSYLIRNGVVVLPVVSKERPDLLVEVLVDVYGTVRDKTDWFLTNKERLSAVTSFEFVVSPFEKSNVKPKSIRIGYEAEYIENYNLWIGPIEKNVKVSEYQYNNLLGVMGEPTVLKKSAVIEGNRPSSQPPVILPGTVGGGDTSGGSSIFNGYYGPR